MMMIETTSGLCRACWEMKTAARAIRFRQRRWLECALYTGRGNIAATRRLPVLLNGNHEEITCWREENSRRRTLEWRPDIITEEEAKES